MADPQTQAISAVEKVPDEIWYDIFMHVALDHPQRDERGFPTDGPHPLLPVAQANKRFNAVAGPLLVTKWHLTPTRESGAKFARHLLKHPHLRSRVKSLGLSVLTFTPTRPQARRASLRNRWPPSFIPTAEAEQLVESAEKTCPPLAELESGDWKINWTDQIGKRSPDAISALVLAWVIELQELDLTWDDDSEDTCGPDPWLIRLVKLAVGVLSPSVGQVPDLQPPTMFQNLHSVTLWRYDSEPRILGPHAAPFFRLPSLRVFKAYNMDAAGLTLDEPDPFSRTALQPPADQLFLKGSNVEELYLYRSCITENGVTVLTTACRCLRVLVLQWENSSFFPSINNDSPGYALANAIELHSASLEEVSIASTEGSWEGFLIPAALRDSLLLCKKLERLAIDLEVLYGDGESYEENSSSSPLSFLLPPGLASLTLSFVPRRKGALGATKDNVLELLRQCGPNGRCSGLKKLELRDFIAEVDAREDFIVMARKAGVELTLTTERSCHPEL